MKHLQDRKFWEGSWVQHLETYLKAPPRCGIWIRNRFGLSVAPVLEIAGGSCRDSRFLALNGITATGSDFDEKTLDYLREKFADCPLELRQADALAMPFGDKSFGLTFSNGFWVCFADDETLRSLATEQARVTQRWMLILVHNARNRRLVEDFRFKSAEDPLFDIRFFDPDEILALVESFGLGHKSLKVAKFGGIADKLYIKKIRSLPNPLASFAPCLAPRLYSLQRWESTERVACIVELS